MGFYSDYLNANLDFQSITAERKNMLKIISGLRNNRDILVYASDLSKNTSTSIDYTDILPFHDQLSNLKGESIDVIIETPGGFAEVVEDLVHLIRDKHKQFNVIIPGYAKSAGTIFAMAADEILMGKLSALGPIDAQILSANGKRFSAEAFLEGLEKIKQEVINSGGRLNPSYIPILQNISPGEIQHCENAQKFSQELVKKWLAEYKFKDWNLHTSTSKPVTSEEKKIRAEEIAKNLGKHSDWLTHGRSIKITDLENMKLRITDYSLSPDLNEAIVKYYTLLRMTFESTNIYKLFETINSQIYRFNVGNTGIPVPLPKGEPDIVMIDFECPSCRTKTRIQANLKNNIPLQPGNEAYPVLDNLFKCPKCGSENNLSPIRIQIEAQSGKKVVQ